MDIPFVTVCMKSFIVFCKVFDYRWVRTEVPVVFGKRSLLLLDVDEDTGCVLFCLIKRFDIYSSLLRKESVLIWFLLKVSGSEPS